MLLAYLKLKKMIFKESVTWKKIPNQLYDTCNFFPKPILINFFYFSTATRSVAITTYLCQTNLKLPLCSLT